LILGGFGAEADFLLQGHEGLVERGRSLVSFSIPCLMFDEYYYDMIFYEEEIIPNETPRYRIIILSLNIFYIFVLPSPS
jgi:hypothetical protein